MWSAQPPSRVPQGSIQQSVRKTLIRIKSIEHPGVRGQPTGDNRCLDEELLAQRRQVGCGTSKLPWERDCPPGPYRFGPPGQIRDATNSIREECDLFHFWSWHPGGANFLFADGSVHFLAYGADAVLPALGTRAGGEVATLP
jgi:prepilin-type processing-associated H-X9-DG protein